MDLEGREQEEGQEQDQTPAWGPRNRWRVLLISFAALVVVGLVVYMLPSDVVDMDLVGDYRLFGPDDKERLSVVRDEGDGLVVQRVPDVVIDVGWDERYICASRRSPSAAVGELEYYYIDLAKDSGPTRDGVTGPLGKEEFDVAKEAFDLPEFTLHSADLR